MRPYAEIAFGLQSAFALWALLLICLCIACLVLCAMIRNGRLAVLSLALFVPDYLLWQAASNPRLFGVSGQAASMSAALGGMPWAAWAAALSLLTALTVAILLFGVWFANTRITLLSIKRCADKMDCGICYWRENGRVVFSNECMNRLCVALTGHALANGSSLQAAAAACGGALPDGRAWDFACRRITLDGAALYEMIATDVTELHGKTEELEHKNQRLEKMNEELRDHGRRIEEAVRKQEVLQAKVSIHDQMNRLMISTMAADAADEDGLDGIFALWVQNSLLLCGEANAGGDQDVYGQLCDLAGALGIRLAWDGCLPVSLTAGQRNLFLIAAKEAAANAVKHAQAEELRISLTETDALIRCDFRNDLPSGCEAAGGDVGFTGGLANLALLAQEQRGSVRARADGDFALTLDFVREAAGHREEGGHENAV